MTSLTDFSVFLGYASICLWLGAQFPQVVENYRRRSCEGLALPFLANWLLGDISNLIGCLLTHQLPFQTWLATYFVSVDMMLFCQYIYYQHINPPRSRSRLRRMSVDRPSPRYRTLSAVASNVAATAALAAQHDEHAAPHSSRRNRWPQSSRETFLDTTPSRAMSREDDIDDVDEGAYSALADSFHSEGGQTIGNKQVSWDTEPGRRRGNSVGGYTTLTRSAFLPPSASYMENSVGSLARGRSLQRDSEHTHLGVQPSVSRSSRISKQGASMMFLGLFALFGIGGGSFRSNHMPMLAVTGRVLTPRAMNSVETLPTTNPISDISVSPENTFAYTLISIPPPYTADFEPQVVDSHDQELMIGHIFAWICTTLYLTSRLPQIWKNYVRKSVEGLSMFLFVFAFLGNVFYVASILTSPEVFQPAPVSEHFLKESIPYLLGSGGTLVFDITIVTQSFVYRSKPHAHPRHRSHSRSRTLGDEERGLITGDALAHPHLSSQEEGDREHVHSRSQTGNRSRASG